METLIVYILKSAGLLSSFFILYMLLLKNDTSFTANRKFLLAGIVTSTVLPSVYFTKKILINAPEVFYNSSETSNFTVISETTTQEFDWWMIAGSIYLIISGFFLLRFCFRIFQILKMVHLSKIKKEGKFKIIETQDTSGPFSFFSYIFINQKDINKDELQLMLTHEKIHARQFHSVDMILSNFITAVLWFNPISWYYKKSVEQNLEYIADHETAKASGCLQQYQHALVRVSTNQYQNVLVNHFYQSFIKKRILMLNKKTSSRSYISKMSLIFPLLLAFMLTFNVKTEAQVKAKTKVVLNDVQFYPDELASVIITKNSTKAELDNSSRKFKEHGVALQFNRLKFSKDGLLTRINIKYEIARTGDSGNFNKNGDMPIDEIEITLSEDFKIEFQSAKTMNDIKDLVIVADSSNVVFHSGKTHETKTYKHSLGDVTMEKIIITKPSQLNPKQSFFVGNKVQYYATDGDSISGIGQIRNVKTKNGNRITWTSSDMDSVHNKNIIIKKDSLLINSHDSKNVKLNSGHKNNKPLYIVNGEVQEDNGKVSNINPDNIENVFVLKEESAIKKYGTKAENGVVAINTKNNHLFRITAKMTDAELENLKNHITSTTSFKLLINDIERNKKGLISNISVKFRNNSSKMVSGNYSESDGISDIYVGEKVNGGLIIYSN